MTNTGVIAQDTERESNWNETRLTVCKSDDQQRQSETVVCYQAGQHVSSTRAAAFTKPGVETTTLDSYSKSRTSSREL